MIVAAAAYPMDPLEGWDAFDAKAARWVAEAAGQGAGLLVFPEYGAMELAHLDGPDVAGDLEASLWAAARHEARAQATWSALAARHDVHVLAPSGPSDTGLRRPVNRAWLHAPDGTATPHDKQVMTRFERERWDVVPGAPLQTSRVGPFTVGVLICYDAEFPALGAALWDAGCDLILAPSCTDSTAGWSRVSVGARARALEGQGVVAHAPTVGDCPWSPAVDENRGRAALYGPPDLGFPEDGILAVTEPDAPGWAMAEVNPEAIARVRREGHVLNRRHAPEATEAARKACQAHDS